MTDLLRLATELERSGGQHRFAALMHAAISVLLRHERGEKRLSLSDLNLSCTARTVFIEIGDGLVIQLPADEARVLGDFLKEALGENESGVGMSDKAVLVRGERWPLPLTDCQSEHPTGGITRADDSPLMPRRMVPRFAAPIEEDGE